MTPGPKATSCNRSANGAMGWSTPPTCAPRNDSHTGWWETDDIQVSSPHVVRNCSTEHLEDHWNTRTGEYLKEFITETDRSVEISVTRFGEGVKPGTPAVHINDPCPTVGRCYPFLRDVNGIEWH